MITATDLFLWIKGGIAITLPITKEQFESSIINFINKYRRLPYMSEDDVDVEILNDNNELEIRLYKANRYIKEYYKTQEKLTEVLFDKNIISYKLIADTLGLTETVVRNAITKSTANPDVSVRRGIHIFFNKDYYKELGEFATLCGKCTKKCKQEYYMEVRCKKYKEKK